MCQPSVRLKSASGQALISLLEAYGKTPLPHYLEGAEIGETELRKRYQTVFAQSGASVAAPTASLHFTDAVFRSLDERHIDRTTLLLNVGLGTFAPLREEYFVDQRLHSEAVNVAKRSGRPIIAVGTTTTRTLEAFACDGMIESGAGKTDIFIFPPYEFQIVDHLITNFHLPKTSLLLLVDAFLQHKGAKKNVMELYRIAIENRFAFYSFGDSMLIL